MRFVDGGELDGQALEAMAESFVGEALGGDVEELDGAGVEAGVEVGEFVGGERGIEAGGGNALRGEGFDLVAHQGDERGNDERQPGQKQRGKLVAEGFPAAGGKNGEGGAAVQQGADDGFLAITEFAVAEVITEGVQHAASVDFPARGGKREARRDFLA